MRTDSNRWGPWRLRDDELMGPVLEREWDNPAYHYWVELRRCTSSAEVLDTIVHASRASWAGDAVLAELVRALDDVLDPIANLCNGGKAATLSGAKLDRLLAAAVPR